MTTNRPETLGAWRWSDQLLSCSTTVPKLVRKSLDSSLARLCEQPDRFTILNEMDPGYFASGEQVEGPSAFLEKRTADFSAAR